MSINFQNLEDYLSSHFPHMRIDTEHTLAGQITIKFNTTESDLLETEERIGQAVERGAMIFQALFGRAGSPLWILAYEYEGDDIFVYDREYLLQQVMPETANDFETNVEEVNSRMIIINENGEDVMEKINAKITIGKTPFQAIKIKPILKAIANRENGLEPVIGQSVYFFDPVNHTGFHMYDDRGFFIWSDSAEKLRTIYNIYNNWIPGYAKEDIDELFK